MRLQKHIDNHEMIYPSVKKRITLTALLPSNIRQMNTAAC